VDADDTQTALQEAWAYRCFDRSAPKPPHERGRPDGASKDTVNAALSFVAQRRRRIEHLLDDPQAFGLGPDIGNPEIMRQARR
jgi:hypothetical protein